MTNVEQLKTAPSDDSAKRLARARLFWYSTLVLITTLAEASFLASTVTAWS